MALTVVDFDNNIDFSLTCLHCVCRVPVTGFVKFDGARVNLVVDAFNVTTVVLCTPDNIVTSGFSRHGVVASTVVVAKLLNLLVTACPPL